MGKYKALFVVEAVSSGFTGCEMVHRGKDCSQRQHLALARDVLQPLQTMVTHFRICGGAWCGYEREWLRDNSRGISAASRVFCNAGVWGMLALAVVRVAAE